jgi:hypothetical protein
MATIMKSHPSNEPRSTYEIRGGGDECSYVIAFTHTIADKTVEVQANLAAAAGKAAALTMP